ncbi:hit finger domain protein [Colletotrichum karsti]|uniref:Hit finger domain protein n=1 Tax=Colletotrichum karsti TaxID=1095194 RepID=A0A9P6HTY1_9PEZI|nr:hit finger domain protein [Colletotrichum karsti]KAF9870159.1 hit finger domain protein [Colletotrichum karsti]
MSADNDPPPLSPRSSKRSQDEVDKLSDSASKRSKTASPGDGGGRQDEADAEEAEQTVATTIETATDGGARGEMTRPENPTQKEPETRAAPQQTTQAAQDEPETKALPKTKMCGICNEKEGKYKCTRCSLPFCSVPCNKIHRENHPPDPEPAPRTPAAAEPPEANVKAKARDPNNPFSVLDDSDQLRYLFKRYPNLRSRLLDILAATEPPPELQGTGSSLNDMMKAKAMAAANPKKEQWTHDVGIRKGKEALRKARNAAGEEGEGVREYIELINHLVSKDEDAAAEEAIRKSAAERDTELIRRLMAEDR